MKNTLKKSKQGEDPRAREREREVMSRRVRNGGRKKVFLFILWCYCSVGILTLLVFDWFQFVCSVARARGWVKHLVCAT